MVDFVDIHKGMLTPRHRLRLGNKIWVYLCTVANQKYNPEIIARALDQSIATIKRDLRFLAIHGYIPWREEFYKHARKQKISNSLRWDVWVRDNYTCIDCGKRRDLTCDHIIPEKLGGLTELDNLQTFCKSCNSRKNTGRINDI